MSFAHTGVFQLHVQYYICIFVIFSLGLYNIQGGREISAIIVTDDYLRYKKPKSTYNFFFLILIFN